MVEPKEAVPLLTNSVQHSDSTHTQVSQGNLKSVSSVYQMLISN